MGKGWQQVSIFRINGGLREAFVFSFYVLAPPHTPDQLLPRLLAMSRKDIF